MNLHKFFSYNRTLANTLLRKMGYEAVMDEVHRRLKDAPRPRYIVKRAWHGSREVKYEVDTGSGVDISDEDQFRLVRDQVLREKDIKNKIEELL